MLGKKVGIDLGSTLTRVHVKGDGVVSVEPTVVAVVAGSVPPHVVAVGLPAQQQAGRDGVELRSALEGGAVADVFALEAVVQNAMTRACGRQRIFKPDVMVAVLSEMNGRDRLLVLEVCARAGARSMYLIDRPLAAAIGSALPVGSPAGRLVVDIGASTVDAAVIAMEGAVTRFCLPRGGARLTADIARDLGALHDVEIGTAAAEEMKREIASAVPLAEERTLRVAATRDGRPVEVVVSSAEVARALEPWLAALDAAITRLLDETPGPLLDDLHKHTGIVLSGGGAQLRGLDRHVAAVTGIATSVARDPAVAVARGTGAALDSLDVVRRTFLYVR